MTGRPRSPSSIPAPTSGRTIARTPSRARMPTLALASLLLVAGCVSLPGDVDIAPVDAAATPRTLWLTGTPAAGAADAARGGLTPDAPTGSEPDAIAGGNFFTRWGAPDGYAEFVGAPLEESLLVTGNVTITAFARADGPALQAGVFPHFIAYFGTDQALNADGSANAEPVLLPGDVVSFDVELAIPAAGLVLEEGARPRVLLVAVMTQDDAGDVVFLANATETPARVAFDAKPITLPFTGDWGRMPVEHDGQLAGSAYVATREGASQATHPLAPGPGTARVDVGLAVVEPAGFGDIDLAVWTESGDLVARSVTPYGEESIRLYPGVHYPADEGTHLLITVTNYGSASASYRLTVNMGAVPVEE